MVERVFGTAKDQIYETFDKDWVDSIPFVEMGMRSTINNTIKYSPNEVVFGKHLSSFPNDGTEIKPVNIEEHLNDVIQNRKRINESN